ncbi:MAG: GyrI-like domain-containing protein [Propionibacteriaceae bacterium]|jgi:hypothetical protein|nr:GyrI-like domain-containing protein [Propionibacteriaceae bacterium]
MPLDYKKTQKELYRPGLTPSLIDVPEMTFIAVDGHGDPNTSPDYQAAVEALYGLSYTIKMSPKSGDAPEGYFDYVVAPLEGFWNVDDDTFRGDRPIADKSTFTWTSAIRQPEFVTDSVFAWAKETLSKKKPGLDLSKAYLWTFTEGLCAHVMHIGPYDTELSTVRTLTAFIEESGHTTDIGAHRRHHEIYLSDPRKSTPEKMRTVIRHPITTLR